MGLPLPLLNRRRRGGFNPLAIFANGEQGAFFLPSDTMFTDIAGTTIAAVGQQVALSLDKSKGAGYSGGTFTGLSATENATGAWSVIAGSGLSGSSDAITATAAPDNSRIDIPVPTVAGRTYRVTINVSSISAGSLRLRDAGVVLATYNSIGTRTILYAATSTVFSILAVGASTTASASISVRELPGNHARQSTLASRPTYRKPASVAYLEDDGGDSLNWTAPAGNYTVARVNSAGVVTIQTAQALSGATDMLLDAQTAGYVAVNRALTASETVGLTAYLTRLTS